MINCPYNYYQREIMSHLFKTKQKGQIKEKKATTKFGNFRVLFPANRIPPMSARFFASETLFEQSPL